LTESKKGEEATLFVFGDKGIFIGFMYDDLKQDWLGQITTFLQLN